MKNGTDMTQQPSALMAIAKTSDNTLTSQPGVGLQLGSTSGLQWGDVHHWWNSNPHPWRPFAPVNNFTYSYSAPPPNPTEKAFRIVSAMMEKGIVGDLSVKEFVSLVNDVAEIVRKN